MEKYRVAVIVGSLREGSFTRQVARHLVTYTSPFEWQEIEIGHLPLYNEDLERPGRLPAEWKDFRERLRRTDALLFATPEYNRSMPGALKNALDVGSRPYGESAWDGKPGAVISVSPGAIGGFGANHHLRQALTFLNVPVLQQPEAYVGGANKLFDASGRLTNDGTGKFLETFVNAFAAWVEMNLHCNTKDPAGAR